MIHHDFQCETSYLYMVLNGPKCYERAVQGALKDLKPYAHDFEAIAFRGMSGALLAPVLAAHLDKYLIMVRKGENHHSSHDIEGVVRGPVRYAIVDDMIDSGNTVLTIQKQIYDQNPKAVCVGIYLYNCHRYYDARDDSTRFFYNPPCRAMARWTEPKWKEIEDHLTQAPKDPLQPYQRAMVKSLMDDMITSAQMDCWRDALKYSSNGCIPRNSLVETAI